MIGSTHAFLFFFSKPFILSFLLDFSWHDCALILLKISDYLLFSKEYTKYVISTNNLNDLRMQTPKKIYKAIRPCWRFSRLDDGDPLSASAHRLSEQVCFTFLCFNKSVSLESSVDLHVKSILLWKKQHYWTNYHAIVGTFGLYSSVTLRIWTCICCWR